VLALLLVLGAGAGVVSAGTLWVASGAGTLWVAFGAGAAVLVSGAEVLCACTPATLSNKPAHSGATIFLIPIMIEVSQFRVL
jgi:hypothetical protein